MSNDLRIVILISGRGSNLRSLIEHRKRFEILEVLSNKANPPGFNFARQVDIPTWSACLPGVESVAARKSALYARIDQLQPDLVVLAGFMLILDAFFVESHRGKIVNIHPSLLPEFPGLDTHSRALAAFRQDPSRNQHGCTVHLVDAGIDTGPIIAAAPCQIEKTDTEESLASKVLAKEHSLYPFVIGALARGEITVDDANHIHYSENVKAYAQREGFVLSNSNPPQTV